MLRLVVPKNELYNDGNNEFINIPETTIRLEHSLISLSKWESKWHKPFLGTDDKSVEETIDYIRCMTLTQNVKPEVYTCITPQNIKDVNAYIAAPMTATTFGGDRTKGPNKEVITAEIIYYWMVSLNVPFETQKWHLNRLLTLLNVCNIKNAPPKKVSARDQISRNRALNRQRRQKYKSKG